MAEPLKNIKPIRPAKPKLKENQEVGVFLLLIAVGVVALLSLFYMGVIDELIILLGILVLLVIIQIKSPPFIIALDEYQRAVILRFGRFHKVAGPGWVTIIPFIDDPRIVDKRVFFADIKPQQVITKDNIKILIDAITFIKITDPKAAVINIKDPHEAVQSYVQAHLRDVVGKMELESVISQVNIINDLLHKGLEKISRDWGIEVVKVEIQSVELPPQVIDAMHERKAAEQRKFAAEEQARAQAIKIDAVRRAAGQLTDPALQYMYLQALEKVADGKSSKIIFPIELTHLADRLSNTMNPSKREDVEDSIRSKYDEFVLQKSREGVPVNTEEILASLKKTKKKKKK